MCGGAGCLVRVKLSLHDGYFVSFLGSKDMYLRWAGLQDDTSMPTDLYFTSDRETGRAGSYMNYASEPERNRNREHVRREKSFENVNIEFDLPYWERWENDYDKPWKLQGKYENIAFQTTVQMI